MLHRFPEQDGFQQKLQTAELNYVCNSTAASASLAENYVGYHF
jgi:p-hydroxybenzoate 3-monooxygenase